MIRRMTITLLGAAAAASLVAGVAETGPAAGTGVALASVSTNLDNPPPPPHPPIGHGPGWDGRHGNWDGRSGFGRGGGWDGIGGGWDGHAWWVSRQRCEAGHGRVDRRNDRWHSAWCRGGLFNGAPVHL